MRISYDPIVYNGNVIIAIRIFDEVIDEKYLIRDPNKEVPTGKISMRIDPEGLLQLIQDNPEISVIGDDIVVIGKLPEDFKLIDEGIVRAVRWFVNAINDVVKNPLNHLPYGTALYSFADPDFPSELIAPCGGFSRDLPSSIDLLGYSGYDPFFAPIKNPAYVPPECDINRILKVSPKFLEDTSPVNGFNQVFYDIFDSLGAYYIKDIRNNSMAVGFRPAHGLNLLIARSEEFEKVLNPIRLMGKLSWDFNTKKGSIENMDFNIKFRNLSKILLDDREIIINPSKVTYRLRKFWPHKGLFSFANPESEIEEKIFSISLMRFVKIFEEDLKPVPHVEKENDGYFVTTEIPFMGESRDIFNIKVQFKVNVDENCCLWIGKPKAPVVTSVDVYVEDPRTQKINLIGPSQIMDILTTHGAPVQAIAIKVRGCSRTSSGWFYPDYYYFTERYRLAWAAFSDLKAALGKIPVMFSTPEAFIEGNGPVIIRDRILEMFLKTIFPSSGFMLRRR